MIVLEREKGVNHLTQDYELEGVSVTISTYWNPRSGWYLDIVDDEGNDILKGKKIKPSIDLTRSVHNVLLGSITVVDTQITIPEMFEGSLRVAEPLGYDNFGSDQRYQMVYFSSQDIQEFGIV